MSGPKQHFIPQLLLKGFCMPTHGKVATVWEFTKGNLPRPSSTKDVAEKRYFYSKLSPDGSKTLDDQIADYESNPANPLLTLRAIPAGDDVNPAVAAEVVTHLAVRNAHLRDTFTAGVKSLMNGCLDLFGDEVGIRRLFGVDAEMPTPRLQKLMVEVLKKEPALTELNLPEPVLNHVAFTLIKESFDNFSAEQIPLMANVCGDIAGKAKDLAGKGQIKALTASLVPEEIMKQLCEFAWMIMAAPEEGAILPDCVALGCESNDKLQPLMFVLNNRLSVMLMPIASNKVLVGRRGESVLPDLVDFNIAAASCTHSFFVSATNTSHLCDLAERIGSRSWIAIEGAVSDALSEFSPDFQDAEKSESPASGATSSCLSSTVTDDCLAELSDDADMPVVQQELRYPVQFLGCANQESASQISATVNAIVSALAKLFPLDRLDGITFAADYATALRELDRGFPASATLAPTNEGYAVGVAMAPLVVRDGMAKQHIVIPGGFGHAMIADDEKQRSAAIYTLAYASALVGHTGMIETALSGISLSPIQDTYEAYLYPHVNAAPSAYFAALTSAPLDPDIGKDYRAMLTNTLSRAQQTILPARLAYRVDAHLDKFMGIALNEIGTILHHTAVVLGHYYGLSEAAVEGADELSETLEEAGLRMWFDVYHHDLQAHCDRCGAWASRSEFLTFNRHVERLLWKFGIFPWRMPDGNTRVEIPLTTDGLSSA